MATAQPVLTKEYETIYILRSDVDPDTVTRVQERVNEVLDKGKGKLVKVEAWGRRKLAYTVHKQKRGVYVYLKYVGLGGLVQELERNLKLLDAVIKYQTVQTQERVDIASVTVDPEEVKWSGLELPPEEEERESKERALGLLDMTEARPRRDEDEFESEPAAEEEPAAPSAVTPAAAAAPTETK